jgi:AraC-like DNA-binding protein
MPIYMDRHDVSDGVTAEIVADLHQKDLAIQDRFQCRGLTYWFDGHRKTAFCLIEAPDEKSIHDMHNAAHGDVPHSVIEVDPGIVESFLGRIQDPEKTHDTELNIISDSAFRTILVVSLNQNSRGKEDNSYNALIREFNEAIRQRVKKHDGNEIRESDFNHLASFKSVSNAVCTAMEIQQYKNDLAKAKIKKEIGLKIALSAGFPVTKKQLIFEDTIKVAERLCAHVQGEIVLTAEVKELYNNENVHAQEKRKGFLALTPADEKFISKFMDCVDERWNDVNLKVDDFSKPCGCSKSQLYRKLIHLTGQSPNEFIRDFRLNKALKLLKKRTGNISEIAFETGFSSPSYFSKCFQKKYGHSPSGYLLSHPA